MTLPYAEPLTRLEPQPRVIPEPPRVGEPGGDPCGLCNWLANYDESEHESPLWVDENWALCRATGVTIPGVVWLASRGHHDSFADLPDPVAASYGPVVARIERAILGAGRHRAGARLSLGRRLGPLPRVVLPPPAGHARGQAGDAAAVGRPAARSTQGGRSRCRAKDRRGAGGGQLKWARPTPAAGGPSQVGLRRSARSGPAARCDRCRCDRAGLDGRRRSVRGLAAGRSGGRRRTADRAGASRRWLPTATPRPRRSSPRSTRSRVGRTCTDASGWGSGGGSPPAGVSWPGRRRRVPRWR